jgi:hypothetical protein
LNQSSKVFTHLSPMVGRNNGIGSMRGIESEFVVPRVSGPLDTIKTDYTSIMKENGPTNITGSITDDIDDLLHRF